MMRLDPQPGLIRATLAAGATLAVALLNLGWLGAFAAAMIAKGP